MLRMISKVSICSLAIIIKRFRWNPCRYCILMLLVHTRVSLSVTFQSKGFGVYSNQDRTVHPFSQAFTKGWAQHVIICQNTSMTYPWPPKASRNSTTFFQSLIRAKSIEINIVSISDDFRRSQHVHCRERDSIVYLLECHSCSRYLWLCTVTQYIYHTISPLKW